MAYRQSDLFTYPSPLATISWFAVSNRQYQLALAGLFRIVKYIRNIPSMDDEMQTHLFSYRHDGKHWELGIRARNADDARRRIAALTHASYDGVLVAKVPVAFAPLGVLAVWIRNATRTFLPRF